MTDLKEYSFLQKTIIGIFIYTLSIIAIRVIVNHFVHVAKGIELPLSAITFVFMIVLISIWHYKEKKQRIESRQVFNSAQTIIRYLLAIIISSFGWMKIFKLHLNTSILIYDIPMSDLSGYEMATAFFGHSYAYTVLIGLLQIIGALLLMFNKTKFLALFILIPIMLNIITLNIFYSIGVGITIIACVLLLSLIYLLLQDYEKVRVFFFDSFTTKGNNKKLIKYAAPLCVITIPFFLANWNHEPIIDSELLGKYNVIEYKLNNQIVDLANDSILKVIYFDENNDCIFEHNSHKYDKRKVGYFSFDKEKRILEVNWRYPKSLTSILKAKLSELDDKNQMYLDGTMGNDNIKMTLLKEK